MVKEITSSYGSDFLKWEIGLISKCSDHEFIKPDQVAFMWHLVDNQNLCATNPQIHTLQRVHWRHMGILVTRKPSHTIILPAWHGGNRYSTLEHAAPGAKHHGGHISPIRLRRKHCCYFSRKGKDGAHLLHSSSGIYRLSIFHINELHSEFGSDLSQPAQPGKQASNSAWQLWRWWMRARWGKRAQTLPNSDSAEDDCAW